MKNKKYIIPLVLLLLISLEVLFMDKITEVVVKVVNNHPDVIIAPSNEYSKDYEFMFVKESDNYVPYSYNDLVNIFYSVINNGWENFTFYCPTEYEACVADVKKISENEVLLTQINNYANPFNSFTSAQTLYDDNGEITITLTRVYTFEEMKEINDKIDSMLSSLVNNSMNTEDKIKAIHDYIINNSRYDIDKNNYGNSDFRSNNAYGPLIEGVATCNGYADAMALILDRLGVRNYKIASTTHIWNAVYVNDEWLHLDLTWDDPVADDGKNYLYHKYFLVNNEQMKAEDKELTDHIFDSSVYLEFKKETD